MYFFLRFLTPLQEDVLLSCINFYGKSFLYIHALAASGLQQGAFRDILIDGFVPPPSSAGPMFPFYENSAEWDDFGEVINPDDYTTKDEDMDQASMQVSFCSILYMVSCASETLNFNYLLRLQMYMTMFFQVMIYMSIIRGKKTYFLG